MKRGNELLKLAKAELKREKREKIIGYAILTVFFLSLSVLFLVGTIHILTPTGYANSVSSAGGYITSLVIHGTKPVEIWGGIYGLVLRVPGFTQQLSEDLANGTIERADIFFDCIQVNSEGGPEFYVSSNPSLTITGATVSAGNVSAIDSLLGCSNEVFCANNTFTGNMSFYVGSTLVENVPSARTYRTNSTNGTTQPFEVGLLDISGSIAFIAKINGTIQSGYNPAYLVNYQMLLPTPNGTSTTYYFYNDPQDACPGGGIGNSIIASVYGFIFDTSNNPVSNATITVAGNSTQSNSSGFYNLSVEVLEGNFSFVVQKTNYNTHVSSIMITSANYTINKNATLLPEANATQTIIVTLNISGKAVDTGGTSLTGVTVYFGNSSGTTNSAGLYNFTTSAAAGANPFIGILANYDNYAATLNVTSNTASISHNFTMSPANLNVYPTGPYTDQLTDDQAGDDTESEKFKFQAEEAGQDYWISPPEIVKQVRQNTFIEDKISIFNFKQSNMQVFLQVSSEISDILKLSKSAMSISSETADSAVATIYGTRPVGTYTGKITVTGDIETEIPVRIDVVPKNFPVETLIMEIQLQNPRVLLQKDLKYRLNLENLLTEQSYLVDLKHQIISPETDEVLYEETESHEIKNSLSILKSLPLEELEEGEYILKVEANYLGISSSVTSPFTIALPVYLYSFFGIPLWILFVMISFISFFLLNFFLYRRHQQKKKRYHLALNLDLLPKPGERSIKLGHIAEKSTPAYYNIDDMTTHAIVAGATGGGKSISAQVFVEEMLMKNIAVIVFDPTAQWSGMLRKCDDKRMLSLYPKFGLKPENARGFQGNVRQVTNYRESIDIRKYTNPGQIQVFTMNKMDPKQIDIFVAGVINNIFKSDPQEYPGLRVLLVFDEVHRLLPKFGGSGKGFLQIERACREFRKWGYGVMLVSQVLSDFVGEIKANINTEVQMRVAEENDLERIKERYGLDALKSLVRTEVGTAMIQNAEYNKGLPYFVSVRPILHNTRRLSDDVLEKYNAYNEKIEDLEFQIEQLEKEKVDTFDLKMELKLVKDKLMTGNFTVVDIYLEGLGPRLEKQWQTLGKKPKKKEIALIDENELNSSLAAAQKDRAKWQAQNAPQGAASEQTAPKQEDISKKIVTPITLDNGAMISSLGELKDVLPTLDNTVFATHVNADKNEIADWATKNVSPELGAKLKETKDKKSMLAAIEDFLKPKDEKKDEKKTETKEEDKKESKEPEKKEEKSESNERTKGDSKKEESKEKKSDKNESK